MNIIFPLCGKGERFKKKGFIQPKPLIPIFNKEMIFYVLDNLKFKEDDKIFILYNSEFDAFNFSNTIQKKYPQIIFIPIYQQTSGAAETVFICLDKIQSISSHKKCVLLDCDTFYTEDILNIIRNTEKSLVFYTKKENESPIYSYISIDINNKILNIKEKEKISCNANTGCYVFNDIELLKYYCKYIIENKITYKGEPYTSCVISEYIKSHEMFGYQLNKENVFSIGTPQEVDTFINNTYLFLFDLDGTLVFTDNIYFNVWNSILKNYNIELTNEIFINYIHGNSDDYVVNILIPSANVKEISELKDKLFIENINEITMVDDSLKFIQTIKKLGYLCSIVTNCNRNVAETIIKYCKIDKYIDFITIGSECNRPKPYPDPYLETIKKYSIQNENVIIFEDSKSGLLSARMSNVKCIVGLETNYNSEVLIQNGANITYKNYSNISLYDIFNPKITYKDIEQYIFQSLNMPIKEIIIDMEKLKGGYISDVIAVKLIMENKTLNCVLKLENKNETNLMKMAKILGLYERENYFYNSMSKYVKINCPKFYGLISDNQLNTIGILMENLNTSGCYKLNLNLNNEKIETSLQIIDKLAFFHSKYWNKNINISFPELKKHNDAYFNPVWSNFINDNWNTFYNNWIHVLSEEEMDIAKNIKNNFQTIQNNLSNTNLTIIHGDVKSANIFYNIEKNNEPTFLDWQYVCIGKGIQDIMFFLIESFDINNMKLNFPIFKNYYYIKLIEYGVHYAYEDYEKDILDALCYFPYFVAIWFGTTPQDELIDKKFPFYFIKKLFSFLSFIRI